MKDLVFQAARSGLTVKQVRAMLDSQEPGRGGRLEEYISDLWSENRIRIELI